MTVLTLGKRLFKWVAWLIGGALALVLALYAVLLLINLRDQPPSEYAQRLEEIYRNRTVVADADNGYIYALGFPVAPDADPQAAGLQRLEWLKARAEHPEVRMQPDPLQSYEPARSPAVQQIFDACRWGSDKCDTALAETDATLPDWFPAEQWRVDRYRTLLARPGWLETLPPDVAAPLPSYAPMLEAQRLFLAKAHHLAAQNDANAVREILEQDVRFWRAVLARSDILISRMIATAALARHFNMGNLALRRLPPEMQRAAMPETWRVPLTEEELSWHRCFAGEWIYGRSVLREMTMAGWETEPGFIARLQDLALQPLFQLQDTHNQSAETLVRGADALQVPIERFLSGRDAAKEIFAAPAERVGTLANLYNPLGDILSGIGSGTYDTYPPRVADVEGVRRAAVLATELRSRKVDPANIGTELAESDLRMPYTGAPFDWDAKTQAIVFIGLEPSERGHHSFKY